jgi:hypothetical protein
MATAPSRLPQRQPLVRLLMLALLAGTSLGGSLMARAADATATPGGKGAQMYCFMRAAGNSHDVSWTAAYALIKRQSASMFKTSPEHAAVMITEAVVQNPGNFPDCGKYLGSLFEKSASRDASAAAEAASANAPLGTPRRAGATGSGVDTNSSPTPTSNTSGERINY